MMNALIPADNYTDGFLPQHLGIIAAEIVEPGVEIAPEEDVVVLYGCMISSCHEAEERDQN